VGEKSNSNYSEEERIVERVKLQDTPFVAVKQNGKWFATMGSYKLTEDREKLEEVEREVNQMDWEIITRVIAAIVEETIKMKEEQKIKIEE